MVTSSSEFVTLCYDSLTSIWWMNFSWRWGTYNVQSSHMEDRNLEFLTKLVKLSSPSRMELSVHLKASVVEDLQSVFDSHSITSSKFSELVSKKVSHSNSSSYFTLLYKITKDFQHLSKKPVKIKYSPPHFPEVPQYLGNVSKNHS